MTYKAVRPVLHYCTCCRLLRVFMELVDSLFKLYLLVKYPRSSLCHHFV